MSNLTAIICLAVALLLGSARIAWSADFQKGYTGYQIGDFKTALREWTPLAEQSHADAQYNLGLMYANGQGVPQNYKIAVKWYKLAAEQGNAFAQYNLGVIFDQGQGVPQDYKTAVKWYRLAAEQGDADAQFALGLMYALGRGVLKRYIDAHMWLSIATTNGNKLGVNLIGDFAKKMTPAEISTANNLVRECARKNYKEC